MYWDNAEYYGIGAGASGYVNGVRYKNHGPIRHYLKAVEEGNARINEEHLSLREQMEEEMFLGLRKKTGVSKARFERKNLAHLLKNFIWSSCKRFYVIKVFYK